MKPVIIIIFVFLLAIIYIFTGGRVGRWARTKEVLSGMMRGFDSFMPIIWFMALAPFLNNKFPDIPTWEKSVFLIATFMGLCYRAFRIQFRRVKPTSKLIDVTASESQSHDT
jgi:hypothetical protein